MNMLLIFFLVVVGLLVVFVYVVMVFLELFQLLVESSFLDNVFGEMVCQGQVLFVEIWKNVLYLVGNQFNCVNCYFDQGCWVNFVLQWVVYLVYLVFCVKNNKVNMFVECLQGCFQFSMNGKVLVVDSLEIKVLIVYVYWLVSQVLIGVSLFGCGYLDVVLLEGGYSIECGVKVYVVQCVICYGVDGQGQMVLGQMVFLLLWGVQFFNWGVGMYCINIVVFFIKYNMLLGKFGIFSDCDVWDVVVFMNSYECLQDLCLVDGLVEKMWQKFYVNDGVNLYGQKVNGVLLGQGI